MYTHSSLLVLLFVFAMKGNLQIPSNEPSLHVMLAWNWALDAPGDIATQRINNHPLNRVAYFVHTGHIGYWPSVRSDIDQVPFFLHLFGSKRRFIRMSKKNEASIQPYWGYPMLIKRVRWPIWDKEQIFPVDSVVCFVNSYPPSNNRAQLCLILFLYPIAQLGRVTAL